MTGDPHVLCTICARGGSKGVPNKNLRAVGGKPLVAHSITHASKWERDCDVVVSTDSPDIADVGREYGAEVPFTRPAELATDDAPKLPVIQHATTAMEEGWGGRYDYVVDLGVASPLRSVEDIEACFRVALGPDVHNAYTVTEADRNPYFNMVELDDDGYAHLSKRLGDDVERRQDAPTVYAMNASVYVYEREFLESATSVHSDRTKVSVMPPERSVDVDSPLDLDIVRFLFERRGEP